MALKNFWGARLILTFGASVVTEVRGTRRMFVCVGEAVPNASSLSNTWPDLFQHSQELHSYLGVVTALSRFMGARLSLSSRAISAAQGRRRSSVAV